MNYSENIYRLEEVFAKNQMVCFKISLLAQPEVRELYFDNYFDGLLFGKNNEKYAITTAFEGEYLVGSIMYDTYNNYKDIPSRLWVRNRIGDMYVEQPVIMNAKQAELAFGHKNKGVFVVENSLEFTFKNISVSPKLNNPFDIKREEEKKELDHWEVMVDSISVDKKAIKISGAFSEGIVKNSEKMKEAAYCLMWRDNKTKQKYYFHTEEISSDRFSYELAVSEMDELGKNEYNDANFSWFIVDGNKKEHTIFLSKDVISSPVELPTRDINAIICKKDDSTINMRVNTIIMFTYSENFNDGRSIILGFKKKSYDSRVKRFIIQRVNTNIESNLPFTVYKETDKYIYYEVCLTWENIENDFKPGVRQLFVEVENGVDVERHNLKLKRIAQVKENYYIVSPHPFVLVNGYAHSCLLYLDSSNNLKCNVRNNVLKMKVDSTEVKNNNLSMLLSWKKEPYFEKPNKVMVVTDAGEEIEERVTAAKDNVLVSIKLKKYFDCEENIVLKPELYFDNDVKVKVENNFNRPVVNNRETMSFSHIERVTSKKYKRVWGNHVSKSYSIGITEDSNLFKFMGMWLYEKDRLCLKIDWIDEDENHQVNNISVVLRDKVSEETIVMNRELLVEDEYIYYVDINSLPKKSFLPCVQLDNGMLSYIEMVDGAFSIKSSTTKKKISVNKTDNIMSFAVEDLLLFEDDERREEALAIVQKATDEKSLNSKKIWLIGENLGLSARDNGLAFFEYCMKHKDEVDAEFYFVTKEENEDLEALSEYMDNVVFYDSTRHLYLDELAEFYIVSHGVRDVMPSLYHDKTGKFRKPIIYLQHGIAGMKIFDISNKSYGGSIRKFIVSSENEKELLVDNSQFWDDEMVSTGLARYDKLTVCEKNDGKYIWVMPTWRDWLIKSESTFAKSDFYLYYSKVLSDKQLIKSLRKAGQKLVFSLHIEFEKYKPLFDKFENDVIHITDMHEVKISDRVKECSMIATDYSSIIFDIVYSKKPAVFFQFDSELYNKYRGSYVDMKKELPGVVTYTPEAFLEELINNINTNFRLTDIHKKNAKRYFDYCDTDNSKRIYDSIIECREEMADEY
ncbi:CDP-glycerol glycerophosphotransferase family protein [Pseudobutyrivibrio xylanivorans]|uniref:CDP-glycerol glycerophosphotransferase, TagB/SpsB family n=1 Tax=Pseudobutyrivibrio xylanivorans DSM 14809 TaxID=1123012 RepID=A0A1M6JAK5_PSEXY|nr:CDP-glycerol glycerophosphotransferase family protein [Pseudobutyrivibrio xylanivorans]SHJ43717.1 CDP-glycerol glycerophosphotransferase, TagB/SpsB family [Pseudobutyrivibrio xylanivorans DSM 14809]